jgi:hypothetical protein
MSIEIQGQTRKYGGIKPAHGIPNSLITGSPTYVYRILKTKRNFSGQLKYSSLYFFLLYISFKITILRKKYSKANS